MSKRQKILLTQKILGLWFIGGTILIAKLFGGDMTAAIFTIPIGLCLLLSKKVVLDI